MNTRFVLTVLVLLIILRTTLPGAGGIFEHISTEQGLSQSSVSSFVQDEKGFLWIATQDGLNKYDGYNFTTYRHNPSDPTSLPDSHIRTLYKDKTGVLWVGTYNGGLNRFDRETGTFIHYRHDPDNPHSLSHNEISVIYEDGAGTLWMGTRGGGINKLDRETGRFTVYRHIPGNPLSPGSDFITAILESKTGDLWIGTDGGGLNKFDRQTGHCTRYMQEPGKQGSVNDNRIQCILETRAGVLWIGTYAGGLSRMDGETGVFTPYTHQPGNRGNRHGLSHNNVTFIHEDKDEILWVGTNGGGVNLFDPESETFTHHGHVEDTPGSLSHNGVLSIYEGAAGVLWIGTYAGIDKYDPKQQWFHTIGQDPNTPGGLNNTDIRAIYEDTGGILWIGTNYGGLNKYDRKTGIFTQYLHAPPAPGSLADNRVFAILEDSTGTLWVGTLGGGVAAFDRETGVFTYYRHNPGDPGSLSNNKVRLIHEDKKGRLWVPTMGGGLNLFDGQKKSFTRYRHNPEDPSSISSDKVFPIHDGKKDKEILWIGTFGGGLNRFDPAKNEFFHYRNDPKNPNSLSSDRIFSILENAAGIVWIGTDGGGLNGFNPQTGKWVRFSERDGLPSNVVYGILEDHRGHLWLSTTKGLSRFKPRTGAFNNYGTGDGLPGIEFNSGAYFKNASTGEMFFGGIDGVSSFFPASIESDMHMNPVTIRSFRTFNKEVRFAKPVSEMKEIRLSYKENFFSLEFVAPEYRNPGKIRYTYKLEGSDREWVRSGPERLANYTHVPPGEYVFRVKSINQDGAERSTSIRIRVVPPFWQTWWFRSLVFVVFFFLAFVFIQLRTHTIRKRNRRLEQINEQLNREVVERQQAELLQSTLYKIARIAHSDSTSEEIYRSIHTAIGRMIEAKNFYIALYDSEDDTIFLPYFVDEYDDYTGRMLKASGGLTEYVIRTATSLLSTRASMLELQRKGEITILGAPSEIWLGVPLTFKKEIFGALVVQHYTDPTAYTEKDKEMLEFVSGQIAGIIYGKQAEKEKEALKEKLMLSEKMEAIGRLAGGVAHDLNNVLSAIVSYPEVLLLKLPEDSPMRKPLMTMKKSGQRAAAIVQDLLTLARRGVDVKEVVNWNDIIRDYLKSPVFERLKIRHPKVKINIQLEENLLNVEGSQIHLTKTLMNLCSNAAEAMPDPGKGTVTISTRNLYPGDMFEGIGISNYVITIVEDNGVGISEKDVKRIFEPFYTKKKMGLSGTGLGMAIVWNTVHDHNGFINVGSKEGEGTTFELYFPVTHEAPSERTVSVGIDEFMGNGERILVIDDVQEQREILGILLNELGYAVKSVANGEAAVEYVTAQPDDVDLLVLDMIMERGMDGLDTYREILKIKPGMKAIISSGFSETSRVKEAVRLGAGAYIKKPYTLEKIGLALKKELKK